MFINWPHYEDRVWSSESKLCRSRKCQVRIPDLPAILVVDGNPLSRLVITSNLLELTWIHGAPSLGIMAASILPPRVVALVAIGHAPYATLVQQAYRKKASEKSPL